LLGVFTMIGGTAAISTALATRPLPCRQGTLAETHGNEREAPIALSAETCNVTGYFAAAGGVAVVDGIAGIQVFDNCGCVGDVVVVAVRHLARASVAAAIDPHNPVAVVDKEQRLSIPVVGTERSPVVKDDGLPMAPVFIEDLNAILGCDRAHSLGSFA
jgi:hypothetical protein